MRRRLFALRVRVGDLTSVVYYEDAFSVASRVTLYALRVIEENGLHLREEVAGEIEAFIQAASLHDIQRLVGLANRLCNEYGFTGEVWSVATVEDEGQLVQKSDPDEEDEINRILSQLREEQDMADASLL